MVSTGQGGARLRGVKRHSSRGGRVERDVSTARVRYYSQNAPISVFEKKGWLPSILPLRS